MLVKPIEVWYPKRLDDMVGALKQSRFGCFPGRRPRRCRVGRLQDHWTGRANQRTHEVWENE